MKKILGAVLLSLLFAGFYSFFQGYENNRQESVVSQWDIDKKTQQQEFQSQQKQRDWSGEIEFSFCDSIVKYWKDSEFGTRADFLRTGDGGMLMEKIDQYNKENREKSFPVLLNEYCKTKDSSKYIFSLQDKRPLELWLYDTLSDRVEKADFKHFIFDDISIVANTGRRNYGDTSLEKYYMAYREEKRQQNGFGKRNGASVEFVNYAVPLIGHAEVWLMYWSRLLTDWNMDYCTSGLTPEGKLSVCFANVYYRYDLWTNTVYEDKVCSYYIDDAGNINTLQKCHQNTWEYKWYNFVTSTQGIQIYQDTSKKLSIIDIDLQEAGMSFGWVNQTNSQYLQYEDGLGYLNKRFRGKLTSYNLEEEQNDSEFENFQRKAISEAFWENNFLQVWWKQREIFAVVNAQFFNALKQNTTLSFPVKSNGKVLSSYVDNEKTKRTILLDHSWKIHIQEWYDTSDLYNSEYREVLVGIHPDENFAQNQSLWRTYMWVMWENRVVFFIAEAKTQSEMKQIASDYWVNTNDLVMLDGGPSTQFAYFNISQPGWGIHPFYGGWEVPQYIMIYKK